MDATSYLQSFENRLAFYKGDDPLDLWLKFVELLEQRQPTGGNSVMSLVFDRLVKKFLTDERYANDSRFVNCCIKWASFYPDPIDLYSSIFKKGVGTRSAPLYVAWAQQFEQRGMNEQADAVFQKALENNAQPASEVFDKYREFQARTMTQVPGMAVSRNILQNSQLTNHVSSHKEAPEANKDVKNGQTKPREQKLSLIVSRSEVVASSQGSSVQTVAQYIQEDLVCEGSELCFEEVRAKRYFLKLREKQEEQRLLMETQLKEAEMEKAKFSMEEVKHPDACGGFTSQQPFSKHANRGASFHSINPPRSTSHCSRRSLGLRLHSEPTFIQEAVAFTAPFQTTSETSHHRSVQQYEGVDFPKPRAFSIKSNPESGFKTQAALHPISSSAANTDTLHWDTVDHCNSSGTWPSKENSAANCDSSQLARPEEKLDASYGGTANLTHITPNNSLGFVQATPSKVLPSPTVNTREALGVIMDMFQAPTFVEEPFNETSHLGAEPTGVVSTWTKPSTTAPFTIFQDVDDDKENPRFRVNTRAAIESANEKMKPTSALTELPTPKAHKPNETTHELIPDESTTWGARYNALNSLAACPNNTSDFALLAQCVSTPFTRKTPFSTVIFEDQENNCDGGDEDNNVFIRRQTKKLSPITEQSPSEDKSSEGASNQLISSSARQGTIVSEGQDTANHCLTSSSITLTQPPPPAVLSFRDNTLCPVDSTRPMEPSWEVYTSPQQSYKAPALSSVIPKREPFKPLVESLDQNQACDFPMSPECASKTGWLSIRSPEAAVEVDLDAFNSPPLSKRADASASRVTDIPMSPQQLPQWANDVPMSPEQPVVHADEPMMSPERELHHISNIALNTPAGGAAVMHVVADPWGSELICDLLSSLRQPLSSHPRCVTWPFDVPSINPKVTISMGKASLQVDRILGEGAFATVYQAIDPSTSEKMILKVQKPANPWEFYINTQLDARLQPHLRHLYSNFTSAHLFHNGSVLLGELYNFGTLLNAVNIFKSLSERVMPLPLVLYFTVCILHMMEKLHDVHIIHGDIKPDNIMLNESFLESKCVDPESGDHGLVLIDLGQSIDMELFPKGTAFTAKCLTSGFQCTEMLSGKPWNYQTDYFGIAGTVYCMLFGTYMQVVNENGVWRTNESFRRKPHSDLWLDFFHTLLNVPDCGSLPSLRMLRCKLTSVLEENYSTKLSTLKSRLVVLLLENRRTSRR